MVRPVGHWKDAEGHTMYGTLLEQPCQAHPEETRRDRTRYWRPGCQRRAWLRDKCTAIIDSDAVPRAGEAISIRKNSYTVTCVTWAVDYPDNPPSNLRACVVLQPLK